MRSRKAEGMRFHPEKKETAEKHAEIRSIKNADSDAVFSLRERIFRENLERAIRGVGRSEPDASRLCDKRAPRALKQAKKGVIGILGTGLDRSKTC